MKKILSVIVIIFIFVIGILLFNNLKTESNQIHISLGTGGVTGVYYPTGSTICRLVNAQTKTHGVRCSVQSTDGSISNINMIRNGDLDLGIVQTDLVYLDLRGEGPFIDYGPDKEIRSVFSLYTEALTIVARKDANARTFNDLKGKRVNIGSPGSGQYAAMNMLMETKGWTRNDFRLISELKPAEAAQALCDNKVDAIAYFVGQPSGSILEATTSCDSVLISVNDADALALIAQEPYLVEYIIPGGIYRNNDIDTPTLGAKTALVTSTRVSDEAIYQIVRAVFENIDTLRRTHPSLADLNPEDMVTQGNLAPLDPGAKRYYIEAGLLQ